jgi:Subtilisin inhibitor-like
MCGRGEPGDRSQRQTTMKTFAPPAGARHPAPVRHKAGVAAVLGGVVVLAAACGSQTVAGNAAGPGSAAAKPASALTVSVTAAPGATPRRWTLTCGPAGDGGTHPQPAVACAALARARHPFAPVPAGVMCSMIAGGPQTASITGTWNGKRVAAAYSLANGCQIARWDRIWKVLGQVNPGGPMIPAPGSPPSS